MISAIRVADVVAEVKTLLESIDGAVRIATAFAILMGMIVLAGSVVATRRQRSTRPPRMSAAMLVSVRLVTIG